jgi:hypothetical protein
MLTIPILPGAGGTPTNIHPLQAASTAAEAETR